MFLQVLFLITAKHKGFVPCCDLLSFALFFIFEGQHIEALLTVLLIEVRDMNWSQKKAL